MSNTLCGLILWVTLTTTSSAGSIRLPLPWKLTGSTPATSAVATAWTPSVLKPFKRTSSSSSSWLAVSHALISWFQNYDIRRIFNDGFLFRTQMASSTSGPAAANATLTDATVLICSQPLSTDGSGLALRLRSLLLTNALWETGPTPVVTDALSPTTVKTM